MKNREILTKLDKGRGENREFKERWRVRDLHVAFQRFSQESAIQRRKLSKN